jgi:hypothetical protein
MDATQFGGPNAQEPIGRKPDGRCQLNRLSPDRQAAVADYAATHTLPETVEWLNQDSQRTKLKLGLELIAEPFRDDPKARKLYEQACEMIDPASPACSPFHGAGQNSSLPPEGGVPRQTGTPPPGGTPGARRNPSCARLQRTVHFSGDSFRIVRYDAGYEIILARHGAGSRRTHYRRRS